jgi:hypothetical protein
MLVRNRGRYIYLLIIIVMLGFFLRVVAFYGYFGSDDRSYARFAHMINTGQFKPGEDSNFSRRMPPVHALRLGLIFPVAFSFRVAGVNEISMVAYPFILSVLTIPIAFIAARVFFSSIRAGLIAALIQAILPMDVKSASMLLPDLPAAFWINLGVILLFFGSNRDSSRSKVAYGTGAGLCFVVSWFCKEAVCYLLPFAVCLGLWLIYNEKKNFYMLLAVVLVFFAGFAFESLLYYNTTGDFLHRFHEVARNFEQGEMWFFTEGGVVGYEKGHRLSGLLQRLFIYGPRSILATWSYGLTTAVAMLALVYGIYKRWRPFIFVGAWLISLVVMFNFFSPNFKIYQPLPLTDRYLYPILLPSVLLTARFIDFLFSRSEASSDDVFKERAFWGGVLAVCILLICTIKLSKDIFVLSAPSSDERTAARLLSPNVPVYTDNRTKEMLSFFWGFPTETNTRDFAGLGNNGIPAGAYVLINSKWVEHGHKYYGHTLPSFYTHVPSDWERRWSGKHTKLYLKPAEN